MTDGVGRSTQEPTDRARVVREHTSTTHVSERAMKRMVVPGGEPQIFAPGFVLGSVLLVDRQRSHADRRRVGLAPLLEGILDRSLLGGFLVLELHIHSPLELTILQFLC